MMMADALFAMPLVVQRELDHALAMVITPIEQMKMLIVAIITELTVLRQVLRLRTILTVRHV